MTKKTRIRTWIVIAVVCVMCFSDWSFAADGYEKRTVAWIINFIASILSWIWVIFAKIAWEFLSNKWVYGEIIGLDAILWKYRNVVKNMANFALWFYFLYVIFSLLIKKTDVIKEVKDMLLWILVAWVGIQASRFIVAAVIDVSTITFVAAGTLPYQVISISEGAFKEDNVNWDMNSLKDAYKKSLTEFINKNTDPANGNDWFVFSLFSKNSKAQSFTSTTPIKVNTEWKDLKEIMDSILPTAESMEWPLYYMWLVLLDSTKINSLNDSSEDGLKKAIIDVILQWWTTVVYSIEMMVLCILAIMRVLYLWMFIVVSPFAVLLWCIGQSKSKWWPSELSFVKKFTEDINFSSFFLNVFKPTIIALWISLTVIVVSLIRWVLIKQQNGPIDIWWVSVTTTTNATNNSNNDASYNTSIKSESFQFHFRNAAKSILEIFLSILAVVLVYMIIKIAVQMWDGKDFVSKRIKKMQDSIGGLITETPIIPIWSYDEKGRPQAISIKSSTNLWNTLIDSKKHEYADRSSKEMDKVMELWWFKSTGLSETQKTWIRQAWWVSATWMQKLEAMKNYIKKDNDIKWKWLKLNPQAPDPFWREEFTNWLERANGSNFSWDNANVWKQMVDWWHKPENKDTRTLEKLFNEVKWSVQAYAKFFDLWNINSWSELMEKDISE